MRMKENTNNRIKYFNPSVDEKSNISRQRIFHYTSPKGLYGILDNSTIRFTDCQFLNDVSEYTHIKKPLLKALEETKKDLRNDFEGSVLKMLTEDFESDDCKISGKGVNLTLHFTKKRYYIFCASTDQDLLGMWNYYVKGGNYQGYNIGFVVSRLLDCFSNIDNPEVDVFYGKVIYKEKDQIDFLKDLLLKADQKLEDKLRHTVNEEDYSLIDQEIKGEVLNYIENYRLFFKDEAFLDEKEYRFILKLPLEYVPDKNDSISIGFDEKQGVFTPFCDLSIDKEKAINSIVLSPMLESELAKQGLKRYLKHNGYNNKISIEKSKVPIRY